jgi:hypothetical protein
MSIFSDSLIHIFLNLRKGQRFLRNTNDKEQSNIEVDLRKRA